MRRKNIIKDVVYSGFEFEIRIVLIFVSMSGIKFFANTKGIL